MPFKKKKKSVVRIYIQSLNFKVTIGQLIILLTSCFMVFIGSLVLI